MAQLRRIDSRVLPAVIAALGGVLIGFGLLGVFAAYGLIPLAAGIVMLVVLVRREENLARVGAAGIALVFSAGTVGFLLWGSEHVWHNPSCSQHPNQSAGQITYWSGASVTWVCVNGSPVVTHDTR
jgi:hypothetical protein